MPAPTRIHQKRQNASSPNTGSPRAKQIAAIAAALFGRGKPYRAKPATYYPIKTFDGANITMPSGRLTRASVNFSLAESPQFSQAVVDSSAKTIYLQVNSKSWFGPFSFPKGFSYDTLLDAGIKDPKPKTKAEEVMVALSRAVRAQRASVADLPTMTLTWSPAENTYTGVDNDLHSHNALHLACGLADERFEYAKAIWFFDVAHRRFWQAAGGAAGRLNGCLVEGPFKLPAHVGVREIKALQMATGPTAPIATAIVTPRPDTDAFDPRSSGALRARGVFVSLVSGPVLLEARAALKG